jgi:hypothetical protein
MQIHRAGWMRFWGTMVAVALVVSAAGLGAQSSAPNGHEGQNEHPGQGGHAGTPTYRAGLKWIAIPAPTADLEEIGPDYRVLFEPFAPNTNRLLAAYVLPADIPQIRAGVGTEFTRYALVEVPRRAEFLEVTPETYKEIASGVASQFGTNLDATIKTGADELNQRLKDLNPNAGTVTMDKPVQLGALFNESDACGFGLIAPVTAGSTSLRMATGLVLVRVQDRVIYGYVFTEYKDEETAHWLARTTQAWADAILQANRK